MGQWINCCNYKPILTWIYNWPILQYQSIAKNLTKVQFAQNLKSKSDIYEHGLMINMIPNDILSELKIKVPNITNF